MENFLYHFGIAISTFVVTNIDDLMILSVYFSHPQYKVKDIVIGQYLGVITLVIISLSGLILGQIINPNWLRFLGIFPILLGVKDLWQFSKNKKETPEEETKAPAKFHRQFLNIAFVTFANGGDNLGVYTPLFATTDINSIALYIIVFLIMIGVWCVAAYYFVKHPHIKKLMAKFGHKLLPIFLIFLGILILLS